MIQRDWERKNKFKKWKSERVRPQGNQKDSAETRKVKTYQKRENKGYFRNNKAKEHTRSETAGHNRSEKQNKKLQVREQKEVFTVDMSMWIESITIR
jgi:hypothetical protein